MSDEHKDQLEPGEVIRDEKVQTIIIDGRAWHHVRDTSDGRWVYAEVRPQD